MLQFHVAISLVGILSGLVMLYGLLRGRNFKTAIAVFFVTTIFTSLSGFPLPPFGFRRAGVWRRIFVGCAVAALYLNVFVLVAQGFMKVPALHALAPTGSEPPFAIVQGIVLLIFIALGIAAALKFRPIDDRRWGRR